MGNSPQLNCIAQRTNHMVLTDKFGKLLGSPTAGDYLIGFGGHGEKNIYCSSLPTVQVKLNKFEN
jgi:hypothetical protein